jgi:predicted outer membrane protein
MSFGQLPCAIENLRARALHSESATRPGKNEKVRRMLGTASIALLPTSSIEKPARHLQNRPPSVSLNLSQEECAMVKLVGSLKNVVATLGLSLLPLTTSSAAQQQPAPGNPASRPATGQQREQGNDSQARRVVTNKPVDQQGHSQSKDGMIATCLAISNGEEVAMAKLAISKAENEKVRDFAEKMVKDHSDMLAKLERLGGQSGVAEDQAKSNTAASKQLQMTSAGQGGAGGIDFITVKRQIAQQCLQSAEKAWQDKKPADAEMCYVGQQIVMHQQMIDAATVMQQYASGELKDAIEEGIETAKSHKKHAEQLIEELAQESKSK